MKISELISKVWFNKPFGGLHATLDKTPDEWLNRELDPDTLAGYICLLLDITEIKVKGTIRNTIQNPKDKTLVVYNPSLKVLSNVFVWACWSCCQSDNLKAYQVED